MAVCSAGGVWEGFDSMRFCTFPLMNTMQPHTAVTREVICMRLGTQNNTWLHAAWIWTQEWDQSLHRCVQPVPPPSTTVIITIFLDSCCITRGVTRLYLSNIESSHVPHFFVRALHTCVSRYQIGVSICFPLIEARETVFKSCKSLPP